MKYLIRRPEFTITLPCQGCIACVNKWNLLAINLEEKGVLKTKAISASDIRMCLSVFRVIE